MEAVDSYIPTPERDVDKPFLMAVEDTMTITSRGTVAAGRVERGVLPRQRRTRDRWYQDTEKTVCTGIEMFLRLLDEAQAGDNIGCLLRIIKREDIVRGQVLCKPALLLLTRNSRSGLHHPYQGRRWPSHPHSLMAIVLSSTSAPPTLPVLHTLLKKAPKWSCLATMLSSRGELIHPIAMEEGLRFAIP